MASNMDQIATQAQELHVPNRSLVVRFRLLSIADGPYSSPIAYFTRSISD
jgi:hypothetical protein